MKIIGIRNGNGRELPQQVYLIADSAVIKTNKPFFLPHFAQDFKAKAAIALHIDRLGKHIAGGKSLCSDLRPVTSVFICLFRCFFRHPDLFTGEKIELDHSID